MGSPSTATITSPGSTTSDTGVPDTTLETTAPVPSSATS